MTQSGKNAALRLAAGWALVFMVACTAAQFVPAAPKRFQADRSVVVEFIAPDKVDARCRERGSVPAAGKYILGCEKGGLLTLPNPCAWPNESDLRQLYCHELGHANGWPADHPK